MHVTDDAADREPMHTVVDRDFLANSFLPRPIRLRQTLADDHGLSRRVTLGIGEHGTAYDRDADRLEIIATHRRQIGLWQPIGGDILPADLERHLERLVAVQGDVARERDRLHARLGTESGDQPVVEDDDKGCLIGRHGRIRITSPIQIDARRDDIRCYITAIDGLKPDEASHHQPGADEEDEGNRDLGTDEQAAKAAVAA